MEPAIPEFETAFRGYDKEQVEGYITDLQEKIIQLNQHNHDLQERLDAIIGDEKMIKDTLYQAQRYTENVKREADDHKRQVMEEASSLQKKLREEVEQKRQFMEHGLQEMMNRYSSALKELKFVFNSGVVFTEQMEAKYRRLCSDVKADGKQEDETRFALLDTDSSAENKSEDDDLDPLLSAFGESLTDPDEQVENSRQVPEERETEKAARDSDSGNSISTSGEGQYSEEELDRFLRSLRDGEDEKKS
ncbi:DivIVA domain-containing protein [Desulfurispira natronophila]|uniref:Cell division initiation protein n=1 Tax=Desulfurispira natronophila TaxID=682562 RepID=A0A7W7Y4E1_9BACT|nr:DivIVA domain-containing protein [Desulfurispira natronophila]MBB5021833.1 cell division initiation protein [Desulfurispira natronophila]